MFPHTPFTQYLVPLPLFIVVTLFHLPTLTVTLLPPYPPFLFGTGPVYLCRFASLEDCCATPHICPLPCLVCYYLFCYLLPVPLIPSHLHACACPLPAVPHATCAFYPCYCTHTHTPLHSPHFYPHCACPFLPAVPTRSLPYLCQPTHIITFVYYHHPPYPTTFTSPTTDLAWVDMIQAEDLPFCVVGPCIFAEQWTSHCMLPHSTNLCPLCLICYILFCLVIPP